MAICPGGIMRYVAICPGGITYELYCITSVWKL